MTEKLLEQFKSLVGPATFEDVRDLVRRTFPDPKAPAPTDDLVALVLSALPEEARLAIGIAKDAAEALVQLGTLLGQAQGRARGIVQAPAPAGTTYYTALATHSRTGPGSHAFVGRLPMVRLCLPAEVPTDFGTAYGTVFAGDHKVHTVELVNEKYREFLGFEVASVWLTTPARCFGSRFGAIATYELLDEGAVRRAWILEAGMATGEAMVLYTSPAGQPIERVSWYQPTPFSSPTNWYRGAAMFDDAGPRSLLVQVSTPAEREQKKAHVEVAVAYEAVTDVEAPAIPAQITAEAAMRVAAIAVAAGDMNPLYLALAPFGHGLDWIKQP